MRSHRRLPLTPMMLAFAMHWVAIPAVHTAEAEKTDVPPSSTTEPLESTALRAQAALAQATALYRKANFVEAKEQIDEAVSLDPANAQAQSLREDILAVLSQRDNRVQMATNWARTVQDVRTQETVVRIGTLITDGDKKRAAGDYTGAELDYDRAEVAVRSFPYPFPWGDLPAQISGKRVEARALARKQETDTAAKSREDAQERARGQSELQEQALKAKVDELLSRAKDAYKRHDFKRAEVDAWNAYELDRRREDARTLYLDSRRQGHEQFDDQYEDTHLERIARVSESIHRSLIPQSELLVYPEDWRRRSQRKPRELTVSKNEPWVAALNDSLEQRISCDFQDQPFEEVVAYLRKVTGANIIVAPSVQAAQAGGGTVTLAVKDMRFGDALKWILELTSLKMALQNQAIFISNEAIVGSVALRMYDVTDLIQTPSDMPGREMANSSGTGTGGATDLFKQDDTVVKPPNPEELVEFIKKNVAPDQWDEAKGNGIEQRAGSTLFISQVPEIHAQIDQLLTSLRNQQSLQVTMDIRMLNVRKNFFEEIGVDWARGNLVSGNSTDGYRRQNNNSAFNGTVGTSAGAAANALPGNQTTDGYGQFKNPNGTPSGMVANLTHSPFNFIGTDQVSMILSAVETESDAQIVQHPSLTCFNGQRANASFMEQFAYISDYEVVSSNLDPTISVLTFGNIIDIRPVVSSDRKYITLEVRPSSVALQGVFTEIIQAPRIYTAGNGNGNNSSVVTPAVNYPIELTNVTVQTLRSTVMLPDKASLLIGGFQKSLRERTQVGIPFLSHIPFLGRLFSRNGTYDENRQLFYLLHAEIVDLNEKDALQ
jgi:type II secretory pathway component GspD/PulD (secretin)